MYRTAKKYILKKHDDNRNLVDLVFLVIMVAGVLALASLIYFYARPIRTVDIKVPVATDKAEYYPEQEVSGIFFGQIYYSGRVEILRDVFCKNYRGTIKTDEGDDIFKGTSKPNKLEGATRRIGKIPSDVPVGENCVIQFLNTYNIQTPFGNRQIVVDYYTQNFKIIPKPVETPPVSEQEQHSNTSGNTELFPPRQGLTVVPQQQPVINQQPPQSQQPEQPSRPSEPVQPPERCTIRLLGLCVRL